VILVGEMRDLETIQLALTAAETGHLVFGTLHTSGAPNTVDRIIDVFPAGQQNQVRAMVSESLMAVISQSLFKRKDGRGRCAAYEIMVANPAIRNLIRENKLAQIPSIMQTSKAIGMQTMEAACQELLTKNLVTRDEVAFYLPNPR
jgi:twitching motility protein PilT